MNLRNTSLIAAFAASLGLACAPASAQPFARGPAAGYAGDAGRASGYHEDGTLNVFGAHIDPRAARTSGPLAGAGNAVGGIVGGVGNAVGGVVGGVGTAVGGAADAADDVVGTGSIGPRRTGVVRGYGSTQPAPLEDRGSGVPAGSF